MQERLGHKNIKITLDTYSHVMPNMQGEAASLVASMIAAAGEQPPDHGVRLEYIGPVEAKKKCRRGA